MHPNSSSTSSSDGSAWKGVRLGVVTLVSMMLWLIAIDLVAGFFVGTPYGHESMRAGQLTRYFDYGRSVEGKVRAMVGPEGTLPPPLVQAGWIEPPSDQPVRAGKGQDLLVAVYGMSFAVNIAKHMQDEDKRIALRLAGGPGATLSHSYALYNADRGHHEADVVVLGILASSLPALMTISHMTWNFEEPSPHFYPRFSVVDGKLSRYSPSVSTLAQLQAASRDESRWRAVVDELSSHDAFYDPLVFRSWSLDESVLARLARRGWGQSRKRASIDRFHDTAGYTNELGLLDVTRALVTAFITQVRSDGKLPVVLAINDRGYPDHLHRVLAPIVAGSGAVYLSTHEVAPASDASNFLKDGHFVPAKDRLIALKLSELINARLNRRQGALPPT